MTPLLVVEGQDDRRFLMDFVAERFGKVLEPKSTFCTIETDWKSLKNHKQDFSRALDAGRAVVLLLDADFDTTRHPEGGFAKRSRAISQALSSLSVPATVWLWPNNGSDGTLETMLATIANRDHSSIFECFDQYESCLRSASAANDQSYVPPDGKARIYAYLEAINREGNLPKTKGTDRNYRDPAVWNLRSTYLDSLVETLRPHFD